MKDNRLWWENGGFVYRELFYSDFCFDWNLKETDIVFENCECILEAIWAMREGLA